jgi:hypothetical protein
VAEESSVGRLEKKRTTGKSRRRWECNIKINFMDIKYCIYIGII